MTDQQTEDVRPGKDTATPDDLFGGGEFTTSPTGPPPANSEEARLEDEFDRMIGELSEEGEAQVEPPAETPPAEPPADKPAEEPTTEAKTEEPEGEPAEPPAEPAFDVVADIKEKVPAVVGVDKAEDVAAYIQQLHDAFGEFRQLGEFVSKNPRYQQFIERIQKGEDEWRVVMSTWKHLINAPDETDDPDGANEFSTRMKLLEQEERHKEELAKRDAADAEKRQAAQQVEFSRQMQELAKQQKWDEATAQRIGRQIAALVMGDPVTGRVPQDAIRRLYFALTRDDTVKKMEAEFEKTLAEAVKKAKQEGIESVRKAAQQGPQVPAFGTSGDIDVSDEQKEFAQLVSDIGGDLEQEDDWLKQLR